MNIHLHCECSREGEIMHLLQQNRELLININSKISNLMSVTDDIKADVSALGAALTSIATAVSTIAGGIDPNGISAEDAQALKASLDAEVHQAQSILASLTTKTTPEQPTA